MEDPYSSSDTYLPRRALLGLESEPDQLWSSEPEDDKWQRKAQRRAERRARKEARKARRVGASGPRLASMEEQDEIEGMGEGDAVPAQKQKRKAHGADGARTAGEEISHEADGDEDDAAAVDAGMDQLEGVAIDPPIRKSRRSEPVVELSSPRGKKRKHQHVPEEKIEMVDPRLLTPESLENSPGRHIGGPSAKTAAPRARNSQEAGPRETGISGSASAPTNAVAGPSRSIPEIARARLMMSSPRKRRKGDAKEDDEDLRRRFRTPGAADAWLASRWVPLAELKRLEAEGILTYKRGKFTQAEATAIKQHLALFQHVNRVSDDELVYIMMAKGRFSERKDYPKFWPEVPGRPVKSVKDYVKRIYDPRGRKGAWTKSEDEELLQAHSRFPNQWAKIAEIVDRTEGDCRDRYKNELRDRSTRNTGHWSDEECNQLVRCVKEANMALGLDPLGAEAPWDIVCVRMGGSRTRTQCRKKWQSSLRTIEMNKGVKWKFVRSDRPELIKRVRDYHASSEADIVWQNLAVGQFATISAAALQSAWWRLKRRITGSDQMPLDQLLDEMAKFVEQDRADRVPKKDSA